MVQAPNNIIGPLHCSNLSKGAHGGRSNRARRSKHCEACGAALIVACPQCQTRLRVLPSGFSLPRITRRVIASNVVQRYLDGSETRRRTRLGNLRELPPTIEQSLRPRLQRLPLLAPGPRPTQLD
jgi:hypothetical protein